MVTAAPTERRYPGLPIRSILGDRETFTPNMPENGRAEADF
jgi:hypothetical protein